MRIRIQDHPDQTLITLQTGPASYLTLPATPVPTDRPDSREWDIPSLNLTSMDVTFGEPSGYPAVTCPTCGGRGDASLGWPPLCRTCHTKEPQR